MARVTRRKFLKASGAGALAAKASGIAGILAAGKAPAYAQAATVHWLKWNDFVPAGDQILRQSMLGEHSRTAGRSVCSVTMGSAVLATMSVGRAIAGSAKTALARA